MELLSGKPVQAIEEAAHRGGGGPSTSVVLQIFRDGRLAMNRQAVSEKELPGQLSAIYGTRGDKTLFIDAEDGVPYDIVVRALDTCRAPGRAETMGFVLN